MSCLGPRLADLADGRLDPVSADRALVHVAGCPACQRELAEQAGEHPGGDGADAVGGEPKPYRQYLEGLYRRDRLAAGRLRVISPSGGSLARRPEPARSSRSPARWVRGKPPSPAGLWRGWARPAR